MMKTHDFGKRAIVLHNKYRGKIEIHSKVPLKTADDLSAAYTPGVAAVCLEIKRDPKLSWTYTNRANQVAVVTDGTAILGLGDIGPEAGMPVMEGKAAIFKAFAGIDAIPLCIAETDPEAIIRFCKQIQPSFAGINLEDISAPRCFEILEKLEKELDIPVFHDDQDGTAIVTLAALINACRVSGKVMGELRVVINGAGAAGIATARLLMAQGVADIILLDSRGAIVSGRPGLNPIKQAIAKRTNKVKYSGDLPGALKGADVFIGLSKGGLLRSEHIKVMNQDPIVFAMANPVPEIMPKDAYAGGAALVGTGRSDFPNQVNNALVFPGIFRGLLDAGARTVTTELKLKAALALAYCVKKPSKNFLVPPVTDRRIVRSIARVFSPDRG